MSILGKAYFHNEEAAFEHVEAVLWPDGPYCPHCGAVDRIGKIKPNPEKRVRLGLHKCGHCKGQFTVRVGTVFEASKVPLHKWLQALHLMTSSKKGISAHQLHRVLEVTYKTSWFMCHRIREAMRSDELTPFGGNGGIVEVDETFIGHDKTVKPHRSKKGRGHHHKHKVLSLMDRETGKARSMVVDDLKAATLAPILRDNIAKEATLLTDEFRVYQGVGREFSDHHQVRHKMGEYVNRKNPEIHTNTIEGYFSIFKRGMKGVYQHCAKKHLHRYVAEYDFRYNNRSANGIEDQERAAIALAGASGKRLKYACNRPN
ncbi:MAG: IS1595 family transposase [Paracoccaceae bacterium]|nr:IS1595 family transposase [Paracoccaceae bacterium]